MGIHLTGFKKGHCFSLHGLVLHPENNNEWDFVIALEQIQHCKNFFELESICFVDDYVAAEKALERLKKKISTP
jgi:hypothetical protein